MFDRCFIDSLVDCSMMLDYIFHVLGGYLLYFCRIVDRFLVDFSWCLASPATPLLSGSALRGLSDLEDLDIKDVSSSCLTPLSDLEDLEIEDVSSSCFYIIYNI